MPWGFAYGGTADYHALMDWAWERRWAEVAVSLVLSLGCSTLLACSTRSPGRAPRFRDGGEPMVAEDAGRVDAGRRPDAGPRLDAGQNLSNVVVYAHSSDTLFSFSPQDLEVREIGPFRLASGEEAPNMLDLAVNEAEELFTTSSEALFRVDPQTAVATSVGTFSGLASDERLFALTFLAPGELGAGSDEVLVGATNEGAYYRVDPSTARAEWLGAYPDEWQSSGDLVSVVGLGTFATLKRPDFPSDILARILFASDGSSIVTVIGPTRSDREDFRQLFGLGFWGRKLYGFSNSGQLIELDLNTGRGTVVTSETGTDQFWGAGVTTRAPVLI